MKRYVIELFYDDNGDLEAAFHGYRENGRTYYISNIKKTDLLKYCKNKYGVV